MKRFVLTPRARQHVNDIWDYIASDNIDDAARDVQGILWSRACRPVKGSQLHSLIRSRVQILPGVQPVH